MLPLRQRRIACVSAICIHLVVKSWKTWLEDMVVRLRSPLWLTCTSYGFLPLVSKNMQSPIKATTSISVTLVCLTMDNMLAKHKSCLINTFIQILIPWYYQSCVTYTLFLNSQDMAYFTRALSGRTKPVLIGSTHYIKDSFVMFFLDLKGKRNVIYPFNFPAQAGVSVISSYTGNICI